jgi:hypothetical protein
MERPMVATSEGVAYSPPALEGVSWSYDVGREETHAASSPRGIVHSELLGMIAELLLDGKNNDVPFDRFKGLNKLFWTEVGKSTPVMFSNAYERIRYAALEYIGAVAGAYTGCRFVNPWKNCWRLQYAPPSQIGASFAVSVGRPAADGSKPAFKTESNSPNPE